MELQINKLPFDAEASAVIYNKIYKMKKEPLDFFRYLWNSEYMKKYRVKYGTMSSKQIFKRVFGPQVTCINYTHRCWIWTFADPEGKAVVNCLMDKRGIHWEYKYKSPFHTVIAIVQEIEKRLIEHNLQKNVTHI